jgi:hypothetical protein
MHMSYKKFFLMELEVKREREYMLSVSSLLTMVDSAD